MAFQLAGTSRKSLWGQTKKNFCFLSSGRVRGDWDFFFHFCKNLFFFFFLFQKMTIYFLPNQKRRERQNKLRLPDWAQLRPPGGPETEVFFSLAWATKVRDPVAQLRTARLRACIWHNTGKVTQNKEVMQILGYAMAFRYQPVSVDNAK